MKRVLLAALTLASLLPTTSAAAQWGAASVDRTHVDRVASPLELAAWADLGFYAGTVRYRPAPVVDPTNLVADDLVSVTPTFGVVARYADVAALEVVMPLAYGSTDGEGTFVPGNPFVAVHWTPRVARQDFTLAMRVGFGWAFPALDAGVWENLAILDTSRLAMASRGQWNALTLRANRTGFQIPVGVELWLGDVFYGAADAAFSYEMYSGESFALSYTDLDIVSAQVAIEAGAELGNWRFTARVSGVGELDDSVAVDDDFQLAVEPRVTVGFGALFAQLGVLVNLDQPAGVFGTDADAPRPTPGIWCIRLLGGGRF